MERPSALAPPAALFIVLLAMILTLEAVPCTAQQDGAPVSIGTYRVIESENLNETRRLLIHLPRGYEGSTISYPVLYHTYGDYLVPYYAEAFTTLESLATEARIPAMILVGIDNIDRYRDLRPLTHDGSPAGIDPYTRFLVEEVIPFIESNYRTAGYRVLVGPQAGAVFCLHTLQTHPDIFDAFILDDPLVSPPNTAYLLEQAAGFYPLCESLRKFFFVSHDSSDDSARADAGMARLVELMEPARARGLELHLNDISGNDDFIPPLHLNRGLRALFADYCLPPERVFTSLDSIDVFYSELSGRFGYDVAPAEFVMTRSADALLARGETAQAVEILERQTVLYPKMVNGWWRLAGLATDRGEIERAIELYRKCVEINPSMSNFVERRIGSLRTEGGG